jgi:hypothetical protein
VRTEPHVVERVLGHQPGDLVKVYQRTGRDAEAAAAWSTWAEFVEAEIAAG